MKTAPEDVLRIGEVELRFHASEPSATVFELCIPPGAPVPPPHFHNQADEILHGIEGTLTLTVDGETRLVEPGDVVFVRRGCVHHHANLHDRASRTLAILTPGTIGRRYFEEIAGLAAGGSPDPAKVREVMLRHGLTPVPT